MFEDFNQNMEKLSKKDFEDTLSFKRACNLVQEEALHDSRLSQDVLLTYDHLLKSDLPEEVNNAICYNLGEMLHYQPEFKKDIKNVVTKHQEKIDAYVDNYTTSFNDGLKSLSDEVSMDKQTKDMLIESKLKSIRKSFVSAPQPLPQITSDLKPVFMKNLGKKIEY